MYRLTVAMIPLSPRCLTLSFLFALQLNSERRRRTNRREIAVVGAV